jgi:GTP cyclohydrolase I
MNQLKVRHYFSLLMSEGLGLDLSDPNLKDTPKRVAKMYCSEFFSKMNEEFTDFKTFPNIGNYDEIILSDNIHFVSICSHHFLPFVGLAWLMYIPKDKLIGASKMARLVEHYSSRPQLQEILCHEIITAFEDGLKPLGSMIVMRAVHECMSCRGVKQHGKAGLTTSVIKGAFLKDSVKQEGLRLIQLSL